MTIDPHPDEMISVDPRTGVGTPTGIRATSNEEVAVSVGRADAAVPALGSMGRRGRAALLDALAEGLDVVRPELVETAGRETGLANARLDGEVSRTTFQLRLFAEAVREGAFLEATLDRAGDTVLGPAPDIRRMLVPLGAVAVFGASNFPLAFSVPGGDTASALASGCPVVVKAHESHPLTSELAFHTMAGVVASLGAPEGTIGMVHGRQAGAALVTDPRIRAVGFTGSLAGGRALLDLVNARDEPIPFYGELGSLNPVVITAAAAAARGDEIADGLIQSVTGSAGQLCTKPGLALVPAGIDGDHLVDLLADRLEAVTAPVPLSFGIGDAYARSVARLAAAPTVRVRARGNLVDSAGARVVPNLLVTDAADEAPVLEECFGPLVVLIRYQDEAQLRQTLARFPGSLTATVHSEPNEQIADLVERLAALAGRLVFNGYPTGVRVSWAQHHGGPWPATNTLHTSVGVSAMRRFMRPLAWQDAPQSLLPPELRDEYDEVPRRIDGRLERGRSQV